MNRLRIISPKLFLILHLYILIGNYIKTDVLITRQNRSTRDKPQKQTERKNLCCYIISYRQSMHFIKISYFTITYRLNIKLNINK